MPINPSQKDLENEEKSSKRKNKKDLLEQITDLANSDSNLPNDDSAKMVNTASKQSSSLISPKSINASQIDSLIPDIYTPVNDKQNNINKSLNIFNPPKNFLKVTNFNPIDLSKQSEPQSGYANNLKNQDKQTQLLIQILQAIETENIELLEFLGNQKAVLTNALLNIALDKGKTKVAKYFFAIGLTLQPEWRTTQKLETALSSHNFELAELLLEHGVQLDDSLLKDAVARGDIEVTQYLLDKGRCVSCEIFFKAVGQGNKKIIELLLQKGADVNGINDEKTPLDIAYLFNFKEIITLLKQYNGRTFAQIKTAAEYNEINNFELENDTEFHRFNRSASSKKLTGFKFRVSIKQTSITPNNNDDPLIKELQKASYAIDSFKKINIEAATNQATATQEALKRGELDQTRYNHLANARQRLLDGGQYTIYVETVTGQINFYDIFRFYSLIYNLSNLLNIKQIKPGIKPASDIAISPYISGRYDGNNESDALYLDEKSEKFIKHVKPIQHQLVLFACTNTLYQLKLHADSLAANTLYTFFANSNIAEAEVINKFIQGISEQTLLSEAMAYIRKTLIELNKQSQGLIESLLDKTGKLIKELQRNLDRPELRALRSYAEKLESCANDATAEKKAKTLHQYLDELLDETNADNICAKLTTIKNLPLFNSPRNIINFDQPTTISLLETAIQSIKANVNNGLFINQTKMFTPNLQQHRI